MTDITLEQRALLAALEMAVMQNSHDMLMTGEQIRQCEHAMRQYREALRLSAGADWVLVPRHHVENVLAAACILEQRGDQDDVREAAALRKLAAVFAAAPRHETGEGS